MKKNESLFKELDKLNDEYIVEVYEEMSMKDKTNSMKIVKWIGVTAAALMILVTVPNASPTFAKALADIPVLGKFFQVITINKIDEEKGMSSISAETPSIINDNDSASIEEINTSAETYTNRLIEIFQKDFEDTQAALDIDYEIVTNTENWFALQISSVEIQASGYERKHYYNIDKATGEYLEFSELVANYDDVKDQINEYIILMMQEEMKADEDKTYFIQSIDGSGFETIAEVQEYYINKNGELVISFDEYEVAPGYMGVVEFTIPYEVYK